MKDSEYVTLTLPQLIDRLKELSPRILDATMKILSSDEGKMYALDLLAASVSKRSMSLVSGFILMIENENFICGAPLLRLQLDNSLRFFASFLVADPHKLAKDCISGIPINKSKDRKTNLHLTDSYLVKRLSEHHDWIGEIYKQTSGYVHLSEKHFFNAFGKNQNDKNLSFVAGEKDHFITEKDRLDAVFAMFQLTNLVLWVLNSWALTKETSDPEEWLKKHGKNNKNANWGR